MCSSFNAHSLFSITPNTEDFPMSEFKQHLFHADMTQRGFAPYTSQGSILGYSLENCYCYIGYDDIQDKPYYISDKFGNVVERSFIINTLINKLVVYSALCCDFNYDPSVGKFFTGKHNDILIEFCADRFEVYRDDTWLAAFKILHHCLDYVGGM